MHSPPSAARVSVDVETRQGRPERERPIGEPALAPDVDGEPPDVEGGLALLLQSIVLDHGAVLDPHLGHRVREVLLAGRARVALDDPGLAPSPRHDEDSRMGHGGRAGRAGRRRRRCGSGSAATAPGARKTTAPSS